MQARTALVVALVAISSIACKRGFGSGFEGEITMHIQSPSGDSDMVVKTKNEKLRFETGKGSAMLFDPGSNKFTMINESAKSYSEIDFKSPSAPQANTSAAASSIDKSGKHETIAGIDCENWTAHDGKKRSEVCIAQGIAFVDMSGGSGALATELREKKLFPLRSVEFDADGKETSRMEVTKVEKKSVDDAQFAVPKDYAKVALPGM